MAKPGPDKKPVELAVLEVGMPSIPVGMSKGARKVFKRLGPELLRYNLMSVVYSDLFEDLCETVADVKELRHSLRARQNLLRAEDKDPAEAFTTKTPGGMPVQHPLYQVLKSERQMMYSLLAKFGLSPAEQANVTTALRAQLKLFDGDGPKDDGGPEKPPAPAGGRPGSFAEFK
jgi:P27 family predicted phage terminase small subunit